MEKNPSQPALKHWMAIPADKRSLLLGNVWCPDCPKPVTICDFSMDVAGKDIVLRGFCATCGHKVARVIEGGRDPEESCEETNEEDLSIQSRARGNQTANLETDPRAERYFAAPALVYNSARYGLGRRSFASVRDRWEILRDP